MCFPEESDADNEVYACFDQTAAKKFESLDADFLNFFDPDSLEHIVIPAVISGDVLCRCGYFTSFPDQILALGSVTEDQLGKVAETGKVTSDQFVPQDWYLTPAACLHFYPMLARRAARLPTALTTRARVFRRENRQTAPLTRLWDFTVREFVFVGPQEQVRERLAHVKTAALDYARALFSDVSLQVAQDSFYPTPTNNAKVRLQRGNARKFELIARFGDRTIALASFNFHDLHFSGAFGFDHNRTIQTGCAGLGLERWLGALALEKGAPA